MTTIAYKNGVVAADSRVTVESESGGARNFRTEKLFRRTVHINGVPKNVILATAGESAPGSLFVEQWASGKSLPEIREAFAYTEPDFTILVVSEDGLFEVDRWCVMEPVYEPFYAIGSGSKVAMGAMEAGASAQKAVEIACRRDPYTAPPVVTMRLKPNANKESSAVSQVSESHASPRNKPGRQNPVAMRKRRRPLLHNDQPREAGDGQHGINGEEAGVQPPAQQADEAVHSDRGAERDSGS